MTICPEWQRPVFVDITKNLRQGKLQDWYKCNDAIIDPFFFFLTLHAFQLCHRTYFPSHRRKVITGNWGYRLPALFLKGWESFWPRSPRKPLFESHSTLGLQYENKPWPRAANYWVARLTHWWQGQCPLQPELFSATWSFSKHLPEYV